jgi:glutathione S-transferase
MLYFPDLYLKDYIIQEIALMKLYYKKGACSLAVRIIIHEIGIDCEFEGVDLHTKRTESGENYLNINPKGVVPTLELEDKSILTENVVIQQYLADTYHAQALLPPPGDIKRYRILEWLNFISNDLHKACGILFNPTIPDEVKETIFKPLLKNKLDLTNTHLSKTHYLVDDQFTLPDSYLFVILSWLKRFNFILADWPALSRYFEMLQQRSSVAKSLKEEGIELV